MTIRYGGSVAYTELLDLPLTVYTRTHIYTYYERVYAYSKTPPR
jgi:hypothetical protein